MLNIAHDRGDPVDEPKEDQWPDVARLANKYDAKGSQSYRCRSLLVHSSPPEAVQSALLTVPFVLRQEMGSEGGWGP